jgi:hypothetical protein
MSWKANPAPSSAVPIDSNTGEASVNPPRANDEPMPIVQALKVASARIRIALVRIEGRAPADTKRLGNGERACTQGARVDGRAEIETIHP